MSTSHWHKCKLHWKLAKLKNDVTQYSRFVVYVIFHRLVLTSLMPTHTHTAVLLLFWNMSGTTRVSRYQKGKTRKVKTNLDLLEQEIVSGSGICWAICRSAPHPRQPCQHPTTQFFTGRMPYLPPNQQRQSTEGTKTSKLTVLQHVANVLSVTGWLVRIWRHFHCKFVLCL